MRSAIGNGRLAALSGEPMIGVAQDVPASLLRGALRAGIDACVYLPDSCLTAVVRAFQSSGKITMVPCAREDEGVAIAVGLELGGQRSMPDGGFRHRLQRTDPRTRAGAAHARRHCREPHRRCWGAVRLSQRDGAAGEGDVWGTWHSLR